MNPRLAALQPYPFEKLATLLADITPNPARAAISLAIGEPQHAPARVACEALVNHIDVSHRLLRTHVGRCSRHHPVSSLIAPAEFTFGMDHLLWGLF